MWVGYVLLFFLGVWIYRSSSYKAQAWETQRVVRGLRTVIAEQEKAIQLQQKLITALKETVALQRAKAEAETVTTDLDRQVAADAMRRELRAKAAVVGVMKLQGCDQTQIDEVMNSIDNSQEGDLA
jgi:hypothetical protein